MKSFIESQFGYCPLIWMFCRRKLNNRINHSHKRSLRIVYNDYESSFQELLELYNSVLIHHRNICLLAIVLFKVKNGLTIRIISELFDLWNIENNFCSQTEFSLGAVYTTNYGLRSLRYFAPNIWNMIPKDISNVSNLSNFALKEKSRTLDVCTCLWLTVLVYRLFCFFLLKKRSISVYMLMNGMKICFYCMFLYNGVNTALICDFVNPTPIY